MKLEQKHRDVAALLVEHRFSGLGQDELARRSRISRKTLFNYRRNQEWHAMPVFTNVPNPGAPFNSRAWAVNVDVLLSITSPTCSAAVTVSIRDSFTPVRGSSRRVVFRAALS